jgi:hypothetical protein
VQCPPCCGRKWPGGRAKRGGFMQEAKPTLRSQLGGTTDSGEDAELSRLGAEFREKHRRHMELVEENQRLTGEPRPEVWQEIQSLMQAKQELAEAIARVGATAISGLRVKAAVLLAYSQYDLNGKLHWTDHNELMGWSIARDLLGDEAGAPTKPRPGRT